MLEQVSTVSAQVARGGWDIEHAGLTKAAERDITYVG